MNFDHRKMRSEFPLLASASGLHYLDNAATSQIHQSALDALVRHETTSRANVQRGSYALAEAASAAYEGARQQVAVFLNAASAEEVVFTSGATAALNLAAASLGALMKPGDEVLISLAEHHSNFLPWQQLKARYGINLRLLPVTAEGRLDLAALPDCVSERCRLIAVTHASNVTGAITDVAAIVAAARRVGARVLLDGAQRVQHGPVDVQALGVDFYACSGHKCFAPGGIGVLWGRAELLAAMPPFMTGGGMVAQVNLQEPVFLDPPRRFEAGTPPIAQAVGLGAAVNWMQGLPWEDIHRHERALAVRLLQGLAAIDGLRLLGPVNMEQRLPVLSFAIEGIHPHDLCQVLGDRGVALRGGHHCARPLLEFLGVEGASRASITFYNDESDIDALLSGLAAAIGLLR